MRKVKWLIVLALLIAGGGWYFLFFKTYSREQIVAHADIVLVVDVKKNTNTLSAWYLRHPSKWGTVFSSKKGTLASFKKAVNIPDYLYFFHVPEQPVTAFFCLLTVNDNTAFQQLLTGFAFNKRQEDNGQTVYFSETAGIAFVRKDNNLLIGTVGLKDSLLLHSVATQLFILQQFIADDILKKITTPANHFTLFIKKGNFLRQDFLLNGLFTNGRLSAEGDIQPAAGFEVNDASFDVPDSSLVTLAFTQPSPRLYAFLPDSFKTKTSAIFNFAMDSMFLPGNKKYLVDIAAIKDRTDSAVTYEYDDNFNKVEKIKMNQVQEPSFNYLIYGDQSFHFLNYLKKNKQIEESAAGNLFTPLPFVKTYANAFKDSFALTSKNYILEKNSKQVTCIGNFCVLTDRLPSNAAAFLPDFMSPFIQKIRSINVMATKKNNDIHLTLTIDSKNRIIPFLLGLE